MKSYWLTWSNRHEVHLYTQIRKIPNFLYYIFNHFGICQLLRYLSFFQQLDWLLSFQRK